MKLNQAEVDWRRQWALIDREVNIPRVKVCVGGPIGAYLRVTNHSALTIGDTIWFRAPKHRENIDLLVHELVHVGHTRSLGASGS